MYRYTCANQFLENHSLAGTALPIGTHLNDWVLMSYFLALGWKLSYQQCDQQISEKDQAQVLSKRMRMGTES